MNKRNYIILILKPVALIGLILIQVYWVKSAIDNKEEAFLHTINQTLTEVSDRVEKQEMNKYVNKFAELKAKDSLQKLKTSEIRDLVFIQENKNTKETFIYNHGILEQGYMVPYRLFDLPGLDSAKIRDYISKQKSQIFQNNTGFDNSQKNKTQSFEKIKRFNAIDRLMFEELFKEISEKLPLINRITAEQIEFLLEQELKNRGINLNFEYAIYDKSLSEQGSISSVFSDGFDPQKGHLFRVPLFKNAEKNMRYELAVIFPKQQRYLLSSVIAIAGLAFVFTLIIIWTFSRTFIQLRTQKQISEMKTDFINNMTHEFKTPIATINLVLDAMKNPSVIKDEERLRYYLKMLRDENRRMHQQVENVLQISKLDKNQLHIEKEPLDLHELIENAIMHTQLLVEDRQGSIRKHLHAENSDIMANELHFTNVLVNVLENAIKYSVNPPEIDIYTEVILDKVLIRISDKGIGMNKEVLKKIFKKFYREHTGDIHNVKGHGLGLAYVKRIVKDHKGEVYAESEKGKGSTFFIKIPLSNV